MAVFFSKINQRWILLLSLFVTSMLVASGLWAKPVIQKLANDEDAICGVWYTNNNNSKVEIYRNNGMYFGKLIWLKDPEKSGYMNKLVILDMTYNQTRHVWDKGTLYYPVKDAQYEGIIELSDMDTLSIRAFKGSPLFGKTVTWIRVK
ncbi:MAG: DUF2147 domain-containing protein [Chitinophagaceae bacterium]